MSQMENQLVLEPYAAGMAISGSRDWRSKNFGIPKIIDKETTAS
jgi:hypothetical protein